MNFNDNRISAEVLPETEDRLNQNLDSIEADLPFLTDLSVEERVRLSKLGRRRVDFVDRGVIHVKARPEYLPPYRPLEEYLKDVGLRDSLHRIQRRIQSLEKRIRDTILLVEAEAFATTRVYYNSVKVAARGGSEDAELIAKDLAYHYKRKPAAKQGSTNTTNTTNTTETGNTSESTKSTDTTGNTTTNTNSNTTK